MEKQELINLLKNIGYSYVDINNNNNIRLVLKLFKNDDLTIQTQHNDDPILLNYIGNYYESKNDYQNMKKWYDLAADKGSSVAKSNLKHCKSESEMLLTTILKTHNYGYVKLKNNNDVLDVIALFNSKIVPEHNNDPIVLNYIGNYYEINNDEFNAIKYYLMAAKKGNSNAIYNLNKWYRNKLDKSNNNNDIMNAFITLENYYYFLISVNKISDELDNKEKRVKYIEFMMKRNVEKKYENNCPICIDDLDDKTDNIILNCGHRYCINCFNNLCNNKQRHCIMCNKNFY